MKKQEFQGIIQHLKAHHKTIQLSIQQLSSFVHSSKKELVQQKAQQVSELSYDLFNYCEKILHKSYESSISCQVLRQKLMRVLTAGKLNKTEQIKQYEERLDKAQQKIQLLLKEKEDLYKANADLRCQLKFIKSFTFQDKKNINVLKPPTLSDGSSFQASKSSVQRSEDHNISFISANSDEGQDQKSSVQLYISQFVDQLDKQQQIQNGNITKHFIQQIKKDCIQVQKIEAKDSDNNNEVQVNIIRE